MDAVTGKTNVTGKRALACRKFMHTVRNPTPFTLTQLLAKKNPVRKPHRAMFYNFAKGGLTVLTQKGRNFEVFLLRGSSRRAALTIKSTTGAFRSGRNPGSPCATGLNGTAGSRIVGNRHARLLLRFRLRLADIEAHIGGETLEQGTGIARLGFVTFLRFL